MASSRFERNVSTARTPDRKIPEQDGELETQHPIRYLDGPVVPGQSPRVSLLNPVIFKSHQSMQAHVRSSTIDAVKSYAAGPKLLAKEIVNQATKTRHLLDS